MKAKGYTERIYKRNQIMIPEGQLQIKLVTIMLGHGDRNHTAGKRAYYKNGKLMPLSQLGVDYCEANCDEAVYEGESNRLIGDEFMKLLKREGIRFKLVNPGKRDMPRVERCRVANAEARKIGPEYCMNIAIHSDAFEPRPDAHGFSCYTSPNQTPSDVFATALYDQAELMWTGEHFREGRQDGDPDKEAKFTVLTDTICPSVLPEFWFFTNYQDYSKHLKTKLGRQECAQVLVNTIKQFYIG